MHDLCLLLLGAFLEIAATVAIVLGPELLDYLRTVIGADVWPGDG